MRERNATQEISPHSPDAAFAEWWAAVVEATRRVVDRKLEPMGIPLVAYTAATPSLNALEEEVFVVAMEGTEDDDERHTINCEHGGFRIMRLIAQDDLAALAWLVHGVIEPTNDRRKRVLDFFRSGPSIQ